MANSPRGIFVMRARIYLFVDELRAGFWFVPSVMLVLASALALILLYVDERFDPGMKSSIAWAYSGGPDGARSLLTTIAGSMITAATVTFSLASVALSIASQQYGSRVLRNFMRDRITQILLGTFTSTFIYSVFVVRDIRGSDSAGGFVPAISITVGDCAVAGQHDSAGVFCASYLRVDQSLAHPSSCFRGSS